MTTFRTVIILPTVFALPIKSADWLVRGAVSLARCLGLSALTVGLTVVAIYLGYMAYLLAHHAQNAAGICLVAGFAPASGGFLGDPDNNCGLCTLALPR